VLALGIGLGEKSLGLGDERVVPGLADGHEVVVLGLALGHVLVMHLLRESQKTSRRAHALCAGVVLLHLRLLRIRGHRRDRRGVVLAVDEGDKAVNRNSVD